ncbi:hypothetical protein F5050DRAFT_1698152 [Lentinula boryana]|uniref:Uncharacterized protein n=1 Tax=Lentinula boryana TaxID=40481 RepID=A0ABQ8Q3I8_9AGAR|nr:hypothetical protein F5050DRAFT_1698152 [Lentinula boryana]
MGQDVDSDIIGLRLPFRPSLVILNSTGCAEVLLVKRSVIYSDRFTFYHESVSGSHSLSVFLWHK